MILNILIHNIFLSAKKFSPHLKKMLKTRNTYQHKLEGGLTIPVIENFIILVSFIRFIFFAIRYNLRTSLFITCIGLSASILWYAHLAKVIGIYQSFILKQTFFKGLRVELLKTFAENQNISQNEGYHIPWYRPGIILYYGLVKGITHNGYYIDPISMILSVLPESLRLKLLPSYYSTYNDSMPAFAAFVGGLWNQFGELVLYTAIARLFRAICPYLVRWHWSLIMLLVQMEYALTGLYERSMFYLTKVLPPTKIKYISKAKRVSDYKVTVKQIKVKSIDHSHDRERMVITGILIFLTCAHLGIIILALVHALLGQYFYIPFFTENTEVHTGFRPTNSIYSRGETPWQSKKKIGFFNKMFYYSVPKFIVIFGLFLSVLYIFSRGLGENSFI